MMVNNRSWLAGDVGFRRMSLIYRGQRDSRWELEPSISRTGVDVASERLATEAFSALLRLFFQAEAGFNFWLGLESLGAFASPDLPRGVDIGAAQHFGLKTSLLDFTTDPAVAVWFACQGSSANDAVQASVFGAPFEIVAANGAALLIPHPYIQRLYRQQGLFVEYQ